MSRRTRRRPPDEFPIKRRPLHPPPMERAGNEPATARSALRLRLLLAVFGAVFCAATAAGMVWVAEADPDHRVRWVLVAVFFGAAAVAAVIDLVVIVNRLRDERRPLR